MSNQKKKNAHDKSFQLRLYTRLTISLMIFEMFDEQKPLHHIHTYIYTYRKKRITFKDGINNDGSSHL